MDNNMTDSEIIGFSVNMINDLKEMRSANESSTKDTKNMVKNLIPKEKQEERIEKEGTFPL